MQHCKWENRTNSINLRNEQEKYLETNMLPNKACNLTMVFSSSTQMSPFFRSTLKQLIYFVATEIATGRRTKKLKFVKTKFEVATIVIIGNYGKPYKRARSAKKQILGLVVAYAWGRYQHPHNVRPKTVPLIKCEKVVVFFKLFNFPQKY